MNHRQLMTEVLSEFEKVLKLISKAERQTNNRIKRRMGQIGSLIARLRFDLFHRRQLEAK